tara:strand:+ start:228 stop:905 length:678 start_codon:yes stop_codon:yes gene_type:complete
MNLNLFSIFTEETSSSEERILNGLYGSYAITSLDKKEVRNYRISVLMCSLSFFFGIIHLLIFNNNLVWIWLVAMTVSLGLSLNWIHIYLRPLHNTLKLFWILGVLGIAIMTIKLGINNILDSIIMEPKWTILIGPLFAALTGLGFKEFFCFRRTEAFALTVILPITLIGYITNLMGNIIVGVLLLSCSTLFLILSARKFGIDPASDIGDKSIFEHLRSQKENSLA